MQSKYGWSRTLSLRVVGVVIALAGMVFAALTGPAQGAVSLGTAEDFAVLANTTITNTGSTTINGDVGLYPGTSVTGFTSVTLNGDLHVTDGVAQQALIDAATTYGVLQGRTPCTDLTGQVLGQTIGTAADPLLPGVYCFSSSAQLTGDLYLSGGGEYIFQIGSTLTTASGSRVILQSGAEACNVFWAVGSSATLGTSSLIVGTIIANTSISATTGAVVEGRLFALTGAVTLQANTITRPICATTTTTTSPPATTTTAAPTTTTTVAPGTTTTTVAPGTTTTTTLPPGVTTTTLPPGVTTTTLAPGVTTTTLPPGVTTTTTTTPPPGVTTTTTLAPGATTTTTLAPGVTTTTTSTSVPATTTSTSTAPVSRDLIGNPTTTMPSTDTVAQAVTTTTTSAAGRLTTTTTADSSRTGGDTTTDGRDPGTAAGTGAGGRGLARTGPATSVRWGTFAGGMALALGGSLVLLGQWQPPRRRPGADES